jgi:DNA mismatch endonuclease, patch repair protein
VTSNWNESSPPPAAWQRGRGVSPAREQDDAAGGHDRRVVPLDDGRIALGSIALRVFPRTRRIRAYLRWSDRGKTRERYLGEVAEGNRLANLRHAWNLAREQGAALPDGNAVTVARGSWASSIDTRAAMRGNRSRDTKPEKRLRSQLHALGLRYRVGQRPIPAVRRTADVVFTRSRIAVFVDGCYWHGCPDHYRPARKNSEFWAQKISANRQRDTDTDRILSEAGWRVIRVWEHEDPLDAAQRIARLLSTS